MSANKPLSEDNPSQKNSSTFWPTIVLFTAASLTVMANATISPALPEIRAHFSDLPGIATLTGLVMTLPSLAIALTGALAGLCADRWGKIRVLLASLLIYGFGGASGWLAADMPQLLAGRLLLGVGVAGVMTTTMALVADYFAGKERENFLGKMSAAQSFGGVLFLILGGVLAGLSWRHPFLLYLLALPVLVLAAWKLRAGSAPLAEKVAVENFPWREVLKFCGLAVFGMVTFYLLPTKLPFLLHEIGVTSPLLAGITVAAATLTGGFASLAFPRLKKHLSSFGLFTATFALMAAGYALMASAGSLAVVLIGAALAGSGTGLLMPNLMGQVFASVPDRARGRASGILTTAVFLGQFVSPLVSGPLSTAVGLPRTFYFFAAALLLAAIATAWLARTISNSNQK